MLHTRLYTSLTWAPRLRIRTLSLLKDETTVCGSLHALTVLPAFGSQTLKAFPAGTGSKDYVADKKTVKKTLSWAEIAWKKRDDDDHSFYEILTLNELIN